MPAATPAQVRAAVARRTPDPVYLVIGDDEAQMAAVAADLTSIVDDELRAFNVERIYAGEKGSGPGAIVEAARQLPMMGDRRVVVVLRGERLLKPKRRGRAVESEEAEEGAEAPSDVDELAEYIRRPEATTVLVILASDVDRTRRIWKSALQKHATIVECWGLKEGRGDKVDLAQAARTAEHMVREAVAQAEQRIEPAAARLLATRAGADVARLRGDLERLLLYATGRPTITLADAQAIVSAETSTDNWAITNAIQQGDAAGALRQLALALDAGGVPYMILGQLAWFVRERLPERRPERVAAAIDALFRTDLDLKTSGGDPRVLLERLVVELSGRV